MIMNKVLGFLPYVLSGLMIYTLVQFAPDIDSFCLGMIAGNSIPVVDCLSAVYLDKKYKK